MFQTKWPRSILLAWTIGGCTFADDFADRATHYNLEAERSKDSGLLLNIMRAAYRKPLQFSDVASVTGTAQVSGGLGTSLPLLGRSDALGRLYQFNPTASAQGGPSFVVNIQNTKEFYQGILQPLPLSTVALLAAEGIPKSLLYTLLISRVTIARIGDLGDTHTISNDVFRADDYARFVSLMDLLLDAGISVEQIDPKPIGAPVSARDAASGDVVAKLRAQGLTLSPRKSRGSTVGYDIIPSSDSYHICFQPASTGRTLRDAGALAPVPPALFDDNACGGTAAPQRQRGVLSLTSAGARYELQITLRSVEGIIYYLGEIAREELGLQTRIGTGARVPPFTPMIRVDVPPQSYSQSLFRIEPVGAGTQTLTAVFQGTRYGVRLSPSGDDRSTQVMELVLEALALNNSAKDQPAPSVITILSH